MDIIASCLRSDYVKVVLVSRCSWTLYNFRAGLIKALVSRGETIIGGGAGGDGYEDKIRSLGIHFETLLIDKGGVNPLTDLRLLFMLYRWYKTEAPDVVHHFTIKPVIYGSIAAYLAGVPKIINTITGLGYVYTQRAGILRRIVDVLYRAALRCATHVFFQNADDRRLFVSRGLVRCSKTSLVPGSGVDLKRFKPIETPTNAGSDSIVVLMVARVLRDKGVLEFVEAAKIVKAKKNNVIFRILGEVDRSNPAAIAMEELDGWVREGIIDWLGHTDDVRPAVQAADIVVLPSYREGTPRSLLEAAAMGKAIVTTDTVGCRNVVDHGINGWLVPIKDSDRLATAIFSLSESKELRDTMGSAGRHKMESEFDERIVIEKTIAVYSRDLIPH